MVLSILFIWPHRKYLITAKTDHFNEGVLNHSGCKELRWVPHQTGNGQKCLYALVLYLHAWVKHVRKCLCDDSLCQQVFLCGAWPGFFLVQRSKKELSFLMDLENRWLSCCVSHKLWAGLILEILRKGWSYVGWSSKQTLGPTFLPLWIIVVLLSRAPHTRSLCRFHPLFFCSPG